MIPRFLLRWLRRLLLLLFVALAVAYLLRDRILARPLAGLVADQLSAALGGRFEVERVEGTWFTNLRVVGLRTVDEPPDGPLTRLDFDRAEVEFSLLRLRLDAVRIDGAVVELDLDRPAEETEDQPFHLADLPPFPRLEANGRVAVKAGERRFSIGRLVVEGDGKAFDVSTSDVDLAGEVTAGRFGGRIERTAPDTLLWTSEHELHGAHPHRVEIVLAGDVAADADLRYGGGHVELDYGNGKLDVVARDVRVDERIRIVALTAAVDPGAGTAAVPSLDAAVAGGRCRVRNARVDFDHPFYVTALDELDVALPDLEPYAGFSAALTARARLDGAVLRVEELAVTRGPSRVAFEGTATLPADPLAWKQTKLDASLQGTLDARSLPPDPERPDVRGSVGVRGSLSGTLEHPAGALSVEGRDLSVAGQPVTRLDGRGTLDWPKLTLETLAFESAPGRLAITGLADLEARTLDNGTYDVDVADLAALARMIPGAPAMEGSLRGEGRMAIGARRTGDLSLSGENLAVEGVALESFAVNATLDGDTVALTTLAARGNGWDVALTGTASVEGKNGSVTTLKANARGRAAELRRPLRWEWRDGAVSLAGLDASVLGGTLTGAATVGETVDVDLTATGLAVLDGAVDATLRASGTLAAPRFELTAKAPKISHEGVEAAVELRLRQEADRVVLDSLRVDGGKTLQLTAGGTWPVVAGKDGVRHTGAEPRLSVEAHADFSKFAGRLPEGVSFARLDLTARVDGLDARLDARVRDLAWTGETRVMLEGETTVAVRGNADGMVARLDTPEGSPVDTSATIRSPVGIDWSRAHELHERLLASSIEGEAELRVPDLSPLAKLEASPVADVRGRATASVKLGGRVEAPEITGTAELSCPLLRLKADVPSFQDLEGKLAFDRERIDIESIRARLGYAPVTVTGVVRPGSIDVHVVGENVLLARTPYLRLRSDVDVTVKGPVEAIVVAGRIDVTDALYSQPIKLLQQRGESADPSVQLFSFRKGPLADMKLDLAVRANGTIRLDNNMLQGSVSADLRIHGTGRVPIQEGRLDFRDLVFTFPVTRERLKIEQGSVVFARGDPFNPEIRVRAEKRKLGYDLTVQVSGKADDLRIAITSVPALPREEAVLLVTAGTLSDNLAQSGAYTAGAYVGRSILERVFGPTDPDEESLFDRFEVETGRDVSPEGDPSIEARFRLSDAERWYAFGERDRWGDYNGGLMLRFRFK